MDDGRKVELAATGHLEKFLVLGKFLHAAHAVLPGIKNEKAVLQLLDEISQVDRLKSKRFQMIRLV